MASPDRQVAATRSAVVYNGVDTESFDPQHFDGARVKRELGQQGKIVLCYVGSYKGCHGLGTTIDVMDLLRKNSSNYHLLLIGTGATYRQVQEKIASKGLQSAVTQLGPIPHEEAPRYLVAFDYALMTYPALGQFYFSPLKMFEYLTMGIRVVATAVGQIKEVIQHGETGFLVDPPTPENFASAVAMAEDDPEARERIGKNGRRLVVERYGWKANAAQVIAVCERAIADRKQTLRESPSSR